MITDKQFINRIKEVLERNEDCVLSDIDTVYEICEIVASYNTETE